MDQQQIKPLVIGDIEISPPLVLAPLAGITNIVFRRMVKMIGGCGLVCSEMISMAGLYHEARQTMDMLETSADEHPVSIQLFGADPAIAGKAARLAAGSGADIIDINFGCAVKKIVRNGAGAALMRNPAMARELILAVLEGAGGVPVTIKMRAGWDKNGDQALKLLEIAQNCGVTAVALHPRTAGQKFSGQADWSLIARIKKEADIPVIAHFQHPFSMVSDEFIFP